MRQALVESYINSLRSSFGKLRMPVEEETLRALYNAKDYAGMVGYIQTVLHLDLNVRLGLVNSGGPNAPAWIQSLTPMPLYGTQAFRQLTVTMYVRKAFLAEVPFDTVVTSMAHELCHIVLNATGHSLRKQEEAVDLLAMLLGFRDFYVTGCHLVRREQLSQADQLPGYEGYSTRSWGYLTREEVSHAAMFMTYR